MLQNFVARAERLYGQACMTFNVHLLLHLSNSVRNLGPLWAHSAFVFEGGNGAITRCVTAAKGIPRQIVERVAMSQLLTEHLITHPPEAKVLGLCQDMLGYKKVQSSEVVDGARVFGIPNASVKLSSAEINALDRSCTGWKDAIEYFRFGYLGTIFWSRQYTRAVRKDSSVFQCQQGKYFVIDRILKVSRCSGGAALMLLCKALVDVDSFRKFPGHIVECFVSLARPVTALPVSSLARPCVLMNFQDEEMQYVSAVPNLVERD